MKTECDYLNGWIKKRSHTQKSHPKVVNPKDTAGERTKKKKRAKNRTIHLQINHYLLSLFVACLMSQQHDSVSQGQICSDKFSCCHTETELAHQTIYLIQSHYTDTGSTSPSADPIMPGNWQDSHWSASFISMTLLGKIPVQGESNLGSSTLGVDALTTRPTRRLFALDLH